jgi:hypothetical protein
MSTLVVRGPLKTDSCSRPYVCDGCGREVPEGSFQCLGRAAGVPIHACSVDCFERRVASIVGGSQVTRIARDF